MANIFLLMSFAIISYGFVDLIRQWAYRRQMLDFPNQRSSHKNPTPTGGGLAIAALTLAFALLYMVLNPNANTQGIAAYIVGGALIAWIGWRDDMHPLPPRQRFTVQIVSGLIAIAGMGYWQRITLPLLGQINLGILGLPLTLTWIVGLVNAYNFMDGIDGIAGSVAVIAGLSWAQINGFNESFVTLLGVVIAGSSLGFLGHNWSPAKIFMGDVGSTFLGYSFAVIPLLSPQRESTTLAAAILLWPFILDTTFTIIRRLRRGENILQSHRSHLYQRLVIAGFSHQLVTTIYIIFMIIGWLAALVVLTNQPVGGFYACVILLMLFSLYLVFVRYQEGIYASRASQVQ